MILFRLCVEQEDGSFKDVGREKHEGGRILHSKTGKGWYDILQPELWKLKFKDVFIPHSRKDRYVMTLEDGTMVFERDKIEETALKVNVFLNGVVEWNSKTLAWSVVGTKGRCSLSDFVKHPELFKIKVTGMVGEGEG
jgi:hypothetical protein